jgi:hypothetical protein
MSSVINLCDSSEDEDVKDTKPAPQSDDDSTSDSSDDEILYAPSIFSQGSKSSNPAIASGDNTTKGPAIKESGSPQKPTANKTNNYYGNFGRKRELVPSRSKNETVAKKTKASDDVIELGSSSDEDDTPKKPAAKKKSDDALSDYFSHQNFNNKVAKRTQVQFDSGDDNSVGSDESSVKSSRNTGEDWTKPAALQKSSEGSTAIRNSYKTNVAINKSSSKQITAAPKENNTVLNRYRSNKNPLVKDSYHSDASSSATCPLPNTESEPRLKSPPEHIMQKKVNLPKEIDLSMDTSDDDKYSQNNSAKKDNSSQNRKSVDWSFDVDTGIDEDESDSSSDLDTKPKAKPRAQATTNKSKSFTLRDRVDDDNVDLEFDDDSSTSSHSIPMFTPRPFKKKTKDKDDAASSAAAAAAASFALSASKSGEDLQDESSSPELMTPRAFSPPSNSPLTTFAVKKKVPIPAIPAMPTELINEIGGKLYPDLKHSFLIALANHARKARHASYERGTFDSALRSIIVLCLHLRPLRSPEAARRIKGVGGNLYELLKESASGPDAKTPFVPKQNRYSCVAAAALVALLELEEESKSTGQCFPMEDLIAKINQLLDSRAKATLNETVEKYLDPNTLDPNWGQVKKLCSSNLITDMGGSFIKERKKKSACASGVVFELLDIGREMAVKLRELARGPPVELGPLRQLPCDTVDEEFGNVTMSMDFREGGGAGKSLHKMCDNLDTRGVPYVVRELKIADYVFFVGDKLAPILIERKTADDVAGSLHDGRWERQQRSMRKAQYVLGGGEERKCQICYIIEGDANKRKVHGGNVGRRSWFQSVEDVENAIAGLPELGFSVMRSKGHLDTIGILAKVAADVSWKVKNGECL